MHLSKKVNEERSGKMEVSKMCFECGAKDNFEYKDTVRVYEGDGYYFEMLVKIPFCKHCNAPIYDEETEREIAFKANEKIRAQRNIITREEILDILESYKISQKFLSKLLGWGEITLTRYVNGNYTPNLANSNRLKSLKNPYIFQMLLQNYREKQLEQSEEKSFIKAQNQVYQRIEELIKKQGKIFNVVNWFLAQTSEEVPFTHLALQKLLYFVQSWSALLLGKDLFWDDCQAWAHGAVYPKVYVLFKEFRYKPLPKVEKVEEFEEKELMILNAVKRYYFDVYSAKALEEICHREQPYMIARKGCVEGEVCRSVIDKKDILDYYKYISGQYDISLEKIANIKEYLKITLDL